MERSDHHEIDLWRDRLMEARLRYGCAKQLVTTLQSRGAVDGALEYAISEQSHALDEYTRCLRVFTELVMRNGG
jgi:hypothetical protein